MRVREPPHSTTGKPQSARNRFRRTLLRVLVVQAVALLVLWLLQVRYG